MMLRKIIMTVNDDGHPVMTSYVGSPHHITTMTHASLGKISHELKKKSK